ncbi:hypothetical protein [Streptosporangium sp. CA-115845]|uniref:hypothetical protein n=1 Tax=Streptosporangium sp. CA-115845 TaxID=3240071 RepID=UPI003D8B20D4
MRRFILALSLLLAGAGTACTSQQPPEWSAELPEEPAAPAGGGWPEALITVPRKLKNGRSVVPLAMLGKDTALLTTSEHRPALLSFNVRTGRQTVLATAPEWAACEECFEIKRSAVNAEQVALLVQGEKKPDPRYDGERHMELWVMPRAGGPMKMVTRLPANGQDYSSGFQITDDLALWWGFDGVWHVPLTGGEPKQVLPGRALRVTSWPWAYDMRRQSIVNLVTHQENKARRLDDVEGPYCGSVWCVGRADAPPRELTRTVIQRVDGSGRTIVSGFALGLLPPIRGRFVLFGLPTATGDNKFGPPFQLYDRCTRRKALLGPPDRAETETTRDEIRYGAATPEMSLLIWEASATRYTVLDLSRISDAPCAN